MYRGFIHPFITGFGAAPLYLPSWAPGWRQMANDGHLAARETLKPSSQRFILQTKSFLFEVGGGIPKPTEKVFFSENPGWL